ncbi:MAG: hypothetical protein QG656_132, partial [Candidatus Hydrogenedentes bacterium]|nr:hypothetical protein [Candidatus Hydrogenedentota bacterium]
MPPLRHHRQPLLTSNKGVGKGAFSIVFAT